jgi:hypothetical protein
MVALLVLSFLPYRDFLEPNISVMDGNSTANLAGNLAGVNITAPLKLNVTRASTLINESNFPESSFNISVNGFAWHNGPPFGGYPGNESSGEFYIWINLTITGHLAPNLDPQNLVLQTNASGPNSLGYLTSSEIFTEFMGVNTTQDVLSSFAGYNSSAGSIRFQNEPELSIFGNYPHNFYNFEFLTVFQIMIASFSGTHHFGYSAMLTGLKETATVGIVLNLTDN